MNSRLKRRYNICHRLRLKGVYVDTDAHAINVATQQQYDELPATARRYIRELTDTYHFVVQTYIPGGQRDGQPESSVKFRRNRQ